MFSLHYFKCISILHLLLLVYIIICTTLVVVSADEELIDSLELIQQTDTNTEFDDDDPLSKIHASPSPPESASSPRLLITLKAISAILLAPILIPLVIIALPIILLLLIPIPVVSIPSSGRQNFGRSLPDISKQLFSKNGQCLDRIVCEMTKAIRKYDFIDEFFQQDNPDDNQNQPSKNKNNWFFKIKKTAENELCTNFTCGFMTSPRNAVKEK